MPGDWIVHTLRRRWRRGRPPRSTERGKRLDPDTLRPGATRRLCASPFCRRQRRLAKMPLLNGGNATPAPSGQWQKCHSQLRTMPPPTGKYPQVKVFTVHRGPVEREISRPFSYETAMKIPDRQKCRWRQIPVHPKGIAQGVSNTGACRPPHMIAPTGGYAGDSGGSHSLVEIAGRRIPNRMQGGTRRWTATPNSTTTGAGTGPTSAFARPTGCHGLNSQRRKSPGQGLRQLPTTAHRTRTVPIPARNALAHRGPFSASFPTPAAG